MIRTLLTFCLLLTLSCQQRPQIDAVEKTLRMRYGWFGDVSSPRITSMAELSPGVYVAQVQFNLKFRKSLHQLEAEIKNKLRGKDPAKSPGILLKILMLEDIKNHCGHFEKGSLCRLSVEVTIRKVRDDWAVDVI